MVYDRIYSSSTKIIPRPFFSILRDRKRAELSGNSSVCTRIGFNTILKQMYLWSWFDYWKDNEQTSSGECTNQWVCVCVWLFIRKDPERCLRYRLDYNIHLRDGDILLDFSRRDRSTIIHLVWVRKFSVCTVKSAGTGNQIPTVCNVTRKMEGNPFKVRTQSTKAYVSTCV